MLPNVINWITKITQGRIWVLEIFLIILFTLIVTFIEKRIYKRLHNQFTQTARIWDDSLVVSLHRPLRYLIWLLGISFAIQLMGERLGDPVIFNAILSIRDFLIIVLLVWFLIRFISEIEQRIIEKSKHDKNRLDETTVHGLSQLLRTTVLVTAVLIAMQNFGIPISGVIAFGGIGGLAIGFAAKDLIANFFGGLMIFLDRPFKVGDWIRSPDKNIEGTVEHIGWRLTKIRTFDKRPLYVPNNLFSTIPVQNPSRMLNRRIYTNVGLRYDDATKVEVVLKDIETMLRSHPEIDQTQTLMVNLVEFGPSSLNFMIYTFTKTTEWIKFQGIQQDVYLKVLEIIDKHGAQCAFPTSTIHVPEGLEISKR